MHTWKDVIFYEIFLWNNLFFEARLDAMDLVDPVANIYIYIVDLMDPEYPDDPTF